MYICFCFLCTLKIISDQKDVCHIFNDFFINVAKDIGSYNDSSFETHPSILKIHEQSDQCSEPFRFEHIDSTYVHKSISKLQTKKATGVDGISAKVLKSCAESIAQPICNLINFSFDKNSFPRNLKQAQVLPIFKKKDPLDKQNYRPVSILPTISKIYERAIHDQLTTFFDNIFSPFLAAFRRGFGCQTTLLRLVEDWKMALDQHKCVAAILMDLSKAFDCLPHGLLFAKLEAYGLSGRAVELLGSYLRDRQQRIKLGPHTSNWADLIKGVPQGSILGPLLFNVFLNDIFYFVHDSALYNYADDNTLSYIHSDCKVLKDVLQKDSETLIEWFNFNSMKANPDKFQAICLGKKANEKITSFHISNTDIQCEDNVTLLGVNIDFLLKFDSHVTDICKKASKQVAVLKRIGKFLTKQGRMVIYNSFILSNFNYCPVVWHFCGKNSTAKMEKIQERALRFVTEDYDSSISDILVNTKSKLLHVSRLNAIANEAFKILNKESPEYLHNLLSFKPSTYNSRRENEVTIPQVNTTGYGIKSFRFEAYRIWNSLPNEIRQAD